MKIAIVGTGAIGLWYGGLLQKSGQDVHFLLRSDYESAKENGICLKDMSLNKTYNLNKPKIYNNPDEIGKCDLVLIAGKSTANEALRNLATPLVDDDTLVVSMQNGLGNLEYLAKKFKNVAMCLCFVCVNRTKKAVVENYYHGGVCLAEFTKGSYKKLESLNLAFQNAQVNSKYIENLDEALWRKLCWNIPFNGLCIALGGVTTDVIVENENMLKIVRKILREIEQIAKAYGVSLTDEFLESQITQTMKMGKYKPSSMIDFINNKPVEFEAIWKIPLERAMQKNIHCPNLEFLVALVELKLNIRNKINNF